MSNASDTSLIFRFVPIEIYEPVLFAVAYVATPVFSFISLFTNCVTVVVFIKQGLGEHVNFTFFCLALTDAILAFVTLSYLFSTPGLFFQMRSWQLNTIVSWTRVMVSDISIALTVFISVQRSLCVIFPFAFNLNFNMRKTKIIICAVFLFVFFNYLPLYVSMTYCTVTNVNNVTSDVICDIDLFVFMARYVAVVFEVVLASLCQICTLVSVIVMHAVMSRSSNIRKGDHAPDGLSLREKRVVKSVVAIAMIYMLTNLPKVLVSAAGAAVQELVFVYLALFSTISNIAYLTSAMTGAFHIVIFYKFNSSFRKTLLNFLTVGRTSMKEKK